MRTTKRQALVGTLALAGVFFCIADVEGGIFRRRARTCCCETASAMLPPSAPAARASGVQAIYGAIVKGTVMNSDNSPITSVAVNVVIKNSAGNVVGNGTSSTVNGIYSVPIVGALQPDNLINVNYNRVGDPKVTTAGPYDGTKNRTINIVVLP